MEGGALARSCAPASTTARTTTPASSSTGWSSARLRRRGVGCRRRPRPRPEHPRRAHRSPGALHRGGAARRGADLPDRRPHPRLRPEPRRARPHPRRGPRRQHRARSAPPRCCRTARSTPGPLREARSTDHYTLAGRAGGEEWEPRFTFHGFRYAEIDGWTGDIDAAAAAGDLVARVYHTDLERTGWFESSDPLVNRLHENVVWGMRGNFVDIPTDCPQRDERVGWTGDIQVFAPTASFLFDASGMLSGWLRDVEAEQLPDGTIPWYVPVIPAHEMWTPIRPGAAWGDVATLTPWTLYERFGDAGILAAQFDSARRWVDLVVIDRGARPAVEHRLPARRLARPGRAAAGSGRRRAPTATSSRPRTSRSRPARSRGWPRCSGAPTTKRTTSRWPTRSTPRSPPSTCCRTAA